MDAQAKDLGANGIDIGCETIGGSILMVSVSGTAVVVDQY